MSTVMLAIDADRRVQRRDPSDPGLFHNTVGLIVAGETDQAQLEDRREELTAFIGGGGRIQINGHIRRRFLPGLTCWQALDFQRPQDLRISRVTEHPVWAGVDPEHFSSGPKPAGAYGYGYHLALPPGATVINGIGRLRSPIDWEYRIGAGRILVHAGSDLLGFADPGTSAEGLCENLSEWLAQRPAA